MVRIGILECDHVDDRYRSIDGDYVDMFAALLERAAPTTSLDLVAFDAINGELPPAPDTCDGWLVTGSRFSVYDDADWIHALSDFVRDIAHVGAPYVGICFGHQLLAHALGGRTEKATTGWGVGAVDTRIEPKDADAVLLYMHQDQVVAVPEGARVLGRTGHCPVAMVQVGAMLGMQAHPEFSIGYVDALLDARVDRIGPEVTARAKQSLTRVDTADADLVGQWIVDFLEGQA